MKMTIAVAAVLAVAVVALTAFRHGACEAHGRDPARMAAHVKEHVDHALEEVGATPDQRQEIQSLVSGVIEKAQAVHQGRADAHAQLLAAWSSEHPDPAALHALVDQRVDALREAAHAAVEAGLKAHDVLTPAQREKLASKLERHAGWHE